MPPKPGDAVRLLVPWAGMAAGSEGVLIGWYVHKERMALVRFWDGGPLQVPADAIVAAEGSSRAGGGARTSLACLTTG